jgi:hypothetical protein
MMDGLRLRADGGCSRWAVCGVSCFRYCWARRRGGDEEGGGEESVAVSWVWEDEEGRT